MPTGLVYYLASDGLGVFAPQGWHCLETYGSDGSNLYVTPYPLSFSAIFSDNFNGISSYGVQLAQAYGDTSGSFEVAKVIARLFPSHWSFTRGVIAEGDEPASAFQNIPYSGDWLNYVNDDVVIYITEPNKQGLGTNSFLRKNMESIHGIVLLQGETPDLVQLSARIPPSMSNLLPYMIHEVQLNYANPAQ